MTWLAGMRIAAIAGGLTLLGAACSDSSSKNKGGDDTGGDGGDGVSAETDDSKKDAGRNIDANIVTPPSSDAGDAGAPVDTLPDGGFNLGDAAITVPDAAVVSTTLTPLPHDGQRGSICYGNGDCKGDDLKCLLPTGSSVPGFCVDDCVADTDCADIDGVKGACNPPLIGGLCEYPCGGANNDGKGACPDDMVCINVSTNLFFPDWTCRYPAGGGKKTEQPYTQCEPLHQGGDCEGLSWCIRPVLSVGSAVFTNGYCSPLCSKDEDCKASADVTAHGFCNPFGTCEFDCSNKGARCPSDMNCLDIDQNPLLITLRCVIIN